jgi:hypothetical protein
MSGNSGACWGKLAFCSGKGGFITLLATGSEGTLVVPYVQWNPWLPALMRCRQWAPFVIGLIRLGSARDCLCIMNLTFHHPIYSFRHLFQVFATSPIFSPHPPIFSPQHYVCLPVVSSVNLNSWPIQSHGSRIQMYGDALSQTVDSNCNGWRKTSAQDAPGGTYAQVRSSHWSSPSGNYDIC